jgi:hypothetical protein
MRNTSDDNYYFGNNLMGDVGLFGPPSQNLMGGPSSLVNNTDMLPVVGSGIIGSDNNHNSGG